MGFLRFLRNGVSFFFFCSLTLALSKVLYLLLAGRGQHGRSAQRGARCSHGHGQNVVDGGGGRREHKEGAQRHGQQEQHVVIQHGECSGLVLRVLRLSGAQILQEGTTILALRDLSARRVEKCAKKATNTNQPPPNKTKPPYNTLMEEGIPRRCNSDVFTCSTKTCACQNKVDNKTPKKKEHVSYAPRKPRCGIQR